ncbi:MAG: SDR family oxidoreductase [Alphaproteobacteria bacterium]|jgi:NAD(P)-dependent dehydrogenase (short-subunit alcohol dehydrogenase family)|nr:SDR family oxidoreductase [Alphaproteobacteria bacterium]MBT4019086.1 SDR family oxidoreductase [Alphaproteobacteria bacterium]MBT4966016.1 SDR family oxidoreductase [Alphaproteobacteria bacterium]MBT5160440.1 SDR family oxidoreductase [Alphaproteobacteria bacterium]MBT5917817.1 SDR family oxidoreductase [Alphaproteobacteria bacterium]
MNTTFDFSGKNVLVSGGTNGINLGVAQCYARAGANVFVFSRDQEKVDSAIELLKKEGGQGGQVAGCTTDVRDHDLVKAAFQQCVDLWGDLDVVVSGAAGNFPAYGKDLSSNGFRAVMEIDLLGTHHVLTAAYPHLKKPGGSVINITAPQSWVPLVGQVHVCAAKAGVDQIMRTLALEWGGVGIRVNSVSPGPIANSGGIDRLYKTKEQLDAKIASVPMGRLGTWEDIGNMCMFLGSDLATYVTGALISVDGGNSLDMDARRLDDVLTG